MKTVLSNLNEVINQLEKSGHLNYAQNLENVFYKVASNFDPNFIDPVGLSDKDVYPDLDIPDHKKNKFDPNFIDPVGLSDKDKYLDMSFGKKKKPFKIRRVK